MFPDPACTQAPRRSAASSVIASVEGVRLDVAVADLYASGLSQVQDVGPAQISFGENRACQFRGLGIFTDARTGQGLRQP